MEFTYMEFNGSLFSELKDRGGRLEVTFPCYMKSSFTYFLFVDSEICVFTRQWDGITTIGHDRTAATILYHGSTMEKIAQDEFDRAMAEALISVNNSVLKVINQC